MSKSKPKVGERDAQSALMLLEEALTILDQLDVPGDVGAHIDLAICRLCNQLGLSRSKLR